MTDTAKPNPLIELAVTLIVPSLILMKLSGPRPGRGQCAAAGAGFSAGLGCADWLVRGKLNLFAALASSASCSPAASACCNSIRAGWPSRKRPSRLDRAAVVVSAHTRYPLVRVLLFSPALMNVERIQQSLGQRGNGDVFETRLKAATWMLGGSFFFSAAMNYFLATWIVVSRPAPRLQRGTGAPDPAELSHDCAALDADHDGGLVLPGTLDPRTCRIEARRGTQILTFWIDHES